MHHISDKRKLIYRKGLNSAINIFTNILNARSPSGINKGTLEGYLSLSIRTIVPHPPCWCFLFQYWFIVNSYALLSIKLRLSQNLELGFSCLSYFVTALTMEVIPGTTHIIFDEI